MGLHPGRGRAYIQNIIFASRYMAYIQGLIKEGEVECTHFASILNQLLW